jgi:ubiquinone/menaquinone biosynthesis C-methylase UbiE
VDINIQFKTILHAETKVYDMEKQTGWNQFKGMETPSTVEIHESFFKAVPEGSDVLDFGCAWGRIAFQLQKLGYNVMGFDLNENVIETVLETARINDENYKGKVKFQTDNATELPYDDESFDACILQAFLTTIISPGNRRKVLSEANRVLNDNGILYLADYGQNWENSLYSKRYLRDYPLTEEFGTFIVTDDVKSCGKELFRAHHYIKEELLELVKQDFRVENFHETVFTTFHGNRTRGYIIIARKEPSH